MKELLINLLLYEFWSKSSLFLLVSETGIGVIQILFLTFSWYTSVF